MAKPEGYQQLIIDLPKQQYPLYIGHHCLTDIDLLRQYIFGHQVLIVTNDTVAPIYLEPLQKVFTSFQCDVVTLPDGETHKNQQSLFAVYEALIRNRHHRDTTLVALGGGVIGDITGLAASTYLRGVNFIQLPTTLMAQIDSSIGGKTGINHPLGKNLIGSFYHPSAVIMDINTLATLPEREFRSGFAEMLKYALLIGGDYLKALTNALTSGLSAASAPLPSLIARSCHIKALFVEEDERDLGKRALLNLGHTFAHALESYSHYQRWLHGEAVAIGLYCAALLSYQLNVCSREHLLLIDSLLIQSKLPRRIPKDVNLKELYHLMMSDKKVKNRQLRLVLIRAPGDCYLTDTVTDESLQNALLGAVESSD